MKAENWLVGSGTVLLLLVVLTRALAGAPGRHPAAAGPLAGNRLEARAIPAALPAGTTGPAGTSRGKVVQEGHWLGLEVLPLTPALAKANNIPAGVRGVLVDEVTLLAAECGVLAGDVLAAVNGVPVPDLPAFETATRRIANDRQASLTVYRQGRYGQIEVRDRRRLGFAQLEAAPMILATDQRPHGSYGACDRCHVISKTSRNTGQLAADLGDVLARRAPAIKQGTAASHGNRGQCDFCHTYRP
ncbi:MAG: PDZ domain-containing protein [Thermodesulfobacteriota bacterium]